MRVSVIIPTYNRAAYLQEALESIFQQTLPPAEVIVVDDGSTDDTEEVVRRARVPVQFVRQEHQGVVAARNLGLQKATGDLIAWLDSDDLWEPNFLETTVSLLAKDRTLDGVYTGIAIIDADGVRLGTSTHVEPPERLSDVLTRQVVISTTSSIVIRKTCYDQVGGFDARFRIKEDADMWLRMARQFRIIGVPQPLMCYRIHATNTMSDVSAFCEAQLAFAQKYFGDLADDGSNASEATRAAYGYAYRSIALKYIETGRQSDGWAYLSKAAALYPEVLGRLDTLYELACGDQPRGYRGKVELLDIPRNGEEMLRQLDLLFGSAAPAVRAWRRAAFGNAYLALGMLSDQAKSWSAARGHLLRALRENPKLVVAPGVLRRLLKVTFLTPRLVAAVRSLRRAR